MHILSGTSIVDQMPLWRTGVVMGVRHARRVVCLAGWRLAAAMLMLVRVRVRVVVRAVLHRGIDGCARAVPQGRVAQLGIALLEPRFTLDSAPPVAKRFWITPVRVVPAGGLGRASGSGIGPA